MKDSKRCNNDINVIRLSAYLRLAGTPNLNKCATGLINNPNGCIVPGALVCNRCANILRLSTNNDSHIFDPQKKKRGRGEFTTRSFWFFLDYLRPQNQNPKKAEE